METEKESEIPAFGLVINRKTDSFQVSDTATFAIAKNEGSLIGVSRINVYPKHDLTLKESSYNTVKKGLS